MEGLLLKQKSLFVRRYNNNNIFEKSTNIYMSRCLRSVPGSPEKEEEKKHLDKYIYIKYSLTDP